MARQRAQRIARVAALGDRLAELGMPIDITPIMAAANENGGRSVGRPQIARALIAAGHVADTREAFDRWLATGRPAFVPRAGVQPQEVIAILHAAASNVTAIRLYKELGFTHRRDILFTALRLAGTALAG